MRSFSINVKKFQGQYYNIIRDTIKHKYAQLYPGQDVEVDYKRKGDGFRFYVYVHLKTIPIQGGISLEKIEITSYDNITAINLFSNIPMENYLEEYDDSRKNYEQDFSDELDAIITAYKLLGLEPKDVEITKEKTIVSFDSPNSSWKFSDLIIAYNHHDIMTKEEKDRNIKYIKSQFKKKYTTGRL